MFGSISYGMIPAAGSASDPLELVATRTLAEVLRAYEDIGLLTKRYVVEVIGDSPYIPPSIGVRTTRVVAEVIGSLAAGAAKLTTVSRAVVEVLGSARNAQQELVAPALTAGIGASMTLFLAFRVTDIASGRQFGFINAAGEGFTVSYESGQYVFRLTSGAGVAETRLTSPGDVQVWSISAASNADSTVMRLNGSVIPLTSWSGTFVPFTMDRIGGDGGTVGEAILFGSQVGDPTLSEIEDYLRVKWA